MPQIIRKDRIEEDGWTLLRPAADADLATLELPATPVLVPLALWQARREELLARATPVSVWLAANENPSAIADDLARLPLIAVDFPKFTDGRGYSIARSLRDRHGYQGEIRAIGDVQRDQLHYMRRCGFDAFAVRADHDIERALAGLKSFSDSYQAAVDEPLPLFRRRGQASGAAA